MTDKEEEERNIGPGRGERMARKNNRDPKERRKQPLETCEAFNCPTPGDRPNKHSKGNESKGEDTATADNLLKRTVNPRITPRLRTSSPTSTTASPALMLEIVCQTGMEPGLENTEKDV